MQGHSIHPSPSAGDGDIIEQSTSLKSSDKKENFIECAQCGFLVNLDKRASGDSLGAIGTPSFTKQIITFPVPTGSDPNVKSTNGGFGPHEEASGVGTVGNKTSDTFGDPIDTKNGCPFCNTMNPKGKKRDALFGTGINLENF